MKNICVFCGSSFGENNIYRKAAADLGKLFAEKNITLVYGGGNIGLMGIIADAVLYNSGNVIGVIPDFLADKELAHKNLTEIYIVKSMHERKSKMAELADAFIAMPGGFGTFDEILEALTWTQLGIHYKPCGFLNVNGFYNTLFNFFDHALNEKFIRPENQKLLLNDPDPESLIEKIINFDVPYIPKWVDNHSVK